MIDELGNVAGESTADYLRQTQQSVTALLGAGARNFAASEEVAERCDIERRIHAQIAKNVKALPELTTRYTDLPAVMPLTEFIDTKSLSFDDKPLLQVPHDLAGLFNLAGRISDESYMDTEFVYLSEYDASIVLGELSRQYPGEIKIYRKEMDGPLAQSQLTYSKEDFYQYWKGCSSILEPTESGPASSSSANDEFSP